VNSGPEQMNPTSMAKMPVEPTDRAGGKLYPTGCAAAVRCGGARGSSTQVMTTSQPSTTTIHVLQRFAKLMTPGSKRGGERERKRKDRGPGRADERECFFAQAQRFATQLN
jgi:hypothetical protein